MSLFFQRVGGFKYFLFSPLEKIPILTNIFSKRLKPRTRFCFSDFLNGVPRFLGVQNSFELSYIRLACSGVSLWREHWPFFMGVQVDSSKDAVSP